MLLDDRLTKASSVYDRLRVDIRHGRFLAGEKLRIDSLMEIYDAGRSPVREALNRLSAEALIEQEDQRGFRIPPLTVEDIVELTKTRCWIEEIALRESIAHGGTDWEESIVLAYYRMSKSKLVLDEPPYLDFVEDKLHRTFHSALISACGSRWLIRMSEALFDQADRYRALAAGSIGPDQRQAKSDEHKAIMDAVLSRDTDLAVQLQQAHMTATAELVQAALLGQAWA